MINGNLLFKQMATEILANSLEDVQTNINVGQQLYENFVKRLYENYKSLVEQESKNVKVFYKNERNILSIQTQTSAIKITINAKAGTLRDEKKLLRDVSNIGHWGSGDYQIRLEDELSFDDVLELIKQIY